MMEQESGCLVVDMQRRMMTCRWCLGAGEVARGTCLPCNGRGEIPVTFEVQATEDKSG